MFHVNLQPTSYCFLSCELDARDRLAEINYLDVDPKGSNVWIRSDRNVTCRRAEEHVCLPLRLATQLTCLDLHYMQAYNIAAKRAHINYLDIVVTTMPILFLEPCADPICYVVRESLNVETQLRNGYTRYYLQTFPIALITSHFFCEHDSSYYSTNDLLFP